MRKKKKVHKSIITFLIAFGVFINLSSNTYTTITEPSKSVISINEDETIDGKH